MNSPLMRKFGVVGKYTEAWLAVLIFIILALFVVPMPTQFIDVLIALNLMFAVIILMTAMYIKNALEFSVFPAMLLVTTLLRIGLSIATTRLILSNTAPVYEANVIGGNEEFAIEAAKSSAGQVIEAFGNFVAGGNAVIGLVIFIIITVVQFVIVAQGSGRVAEVAARFTLDAMPGKQMAIDAEYNQRLITPEEAKEKRANLQAESDFYGSMDGAMKFVKGDAIAGIIIMLVNIIGGFVVGGLMGGMPMGAAAQTFTVLTVGDGLVAQIPALLIAVASGLIVTRAASPRNMGSELGTQLMQSPRALGISAIIIAVLGAVPGLPTMPLWTLASAVGITAWVLMRRARPDDISDDDLSPSGEHTEDEINTNILRVDAISLEVGEDLTRMADPSQDGSLLERLKQVRRRIAMEFGVIAPGVRVKPHSGLGAGSYQLRIKGDVLAQGDVPAGRLLALGPNLDVPGVTGEPTIDPVHKTPGLWIEPHEQEAAIAGGLQVFEPQDVVATHVSEIVKAHLDELLTREEVAELLNMARQEAPTVVGELVPNMLTLGQIRLVLQNLVREQVPIKDLGTILNALADQAYNTKNPFELTEFVRSALGRKICQRYQTSDGTIKAFILHPDAERQIQNSVQMGSDGSMTLQLDPDTSNALQENLGALLEAHRGEILDPVILTNPKVRRYVKKLFERTFRKVVVLSTAEITQGVSVENLGQLGLTRQTTSA